MTHGPFQTEALPAPFVTRYRITASRQIFQHPYTGAEQLPAFELDADYLGLLDAAAAVACARNIVGPRFGDIHAEAIGWR